MKKILSTMLVLLSLCLMATSVFAKGTENKLPAWVPEEEELYAQLAAYHTMFTGNSAAFASYQQVVVTENDLQEYYEALAQARFEYTLRDYFSSESFVTREDGAAFKLVVKSGGELYTKRTDSANSLMARHTHAQSLWSAKWSVHYKWKNGESLAGQFMCHAQFLESWWGKTTWHLEPWRTETNYFTIVAAKCNP